MAGKRCFFIGHCEVSDNLLPTLRAAIEQHITEYGVTEFLVGKYGGFDRLATQCVIEAKQTHSNITLTLLLPYHRGHFESLSKLFFMLLLGNLLSPLRFYFKGSSFGPLSAASTILANKPDTFCPVLPTYYQMCKKIFCSRRSIHSRFHCNEKWCLPDVFILTTPQ